MIKLKNITKKYDDKLVLNNLNITFNDNQINVVSGPSGCGKTTLFNIISGLDKNYEGLIFNIPSKMSYLFQEDRLLPYYSILDNVIFTLPENMSAEEKIELAKFNLRKLGLENELTVFPHELSGGMSRRAAIARALSFPSELLLLDEPFNGLNIELQKDIVDILNDHLMQTSKTIILISHDISILDNIDNINIININNIVD